VIFEELILHDFAQYRGRVAIPLAPPSADKPIILFGGLNGAGKTTLLDAIQLCLFGQLARSARRDGAAYERYLSGLIHRGGGAESASVELRFSHMTHGVEHRYQIRRSWKRTARGCPDALEVIHDDRRDAMATENWAEQVEEFLPARIAHLFLFDGEQIEGYADPKSSAELIETAVYNLLGLDLVEKLGADLSVIERRRRGETRASAEQGMLDALLAEAAAARARVDVCAQDNSARENELDRVMMRREALEERYRKEGGHLFRRRHEVEREVAEAEGRFRQSERALREIVAGAAPILVAGPLFARTAKQMHAEADAGQAAMIEDLLAARDDELLGHIGSRLTEDAARELQNFLETDRAARRGRQTTARLEAGDLALDRLRELEDHELGRLQAALPALIADHEEARLALETTHNQLAAVPTEEAIRDLAAERDRLIAEEAALRTEQRVASEQLDRLRREAERAEVEIVRFEREEAEASLADDDRNRTLRHIGRVRGTLERFRDAVIQRHLARIEALVLDSFQQLLRKKALVASLKINRDTFQLELTGRDGAPLLPDRLSAGERQLLATSVLWGLARASGRPLPMVIDTPLGRLDSSHRRRLVTHYFPLASHQVILLSTDEEIAGGYFEALKPYIGRVYHLNFDESTGATRVEPGYFGELADVA
jgi:DNA sulfur modification protein DndD